MVSCIVDTKIRGTCCGLRWHQRIWAAADAADAADADADADAADAAAAAAVAAAAAARDQTEGR